MIKYRAAFSAFCVWIYMKDYYRFNAVVNMYCINGFFTIVATVWCTKLSFCLAHNLAKERREDVVSARRGFSTATSNA